MRSIVSAAAVTSGSFPCASDCIYRRRGVATTPSSAAARRRGAAEAVVDGEAEAVRRDRHDGDAGEFGPVEVAQRREEVGGRLGEVAGATEPGDGGGVAGRGRRPEGE